MSWSYNLIVSKDIWETSIKELHCLQSCELPRFHQIWYIYFSLLVDLENFLFLQYFRKSTASKTAQNGTQQLSHTSASLANGNEVGKNLEGALENEESLMPMIMPNSFIDAKVLWAERLLCYIILPTIHLIFMRKIFLPKNCMLSVLCPYFT